MGDEMELTDNLLDALKQDYEEMCIENHTEYKHEQFESYLDKVFSAMSSIFKRGIDEDIKELYKQK